MFLSGWGNYPKIKTNVYSPKNISALIKILETQDSVIARGNGLSYGDSSINVNSTILMKSFNKIINFNEKLGEVEVEAGVSIGQIIETSLAKGWFPMVAPGTKFVTIGGAIASDVHGKNHHIEGSFRKCVMWLEVISSDGKIYKCSREHNTELFENTIGGMV